MGPHSCSGKNLAKYNLPHRSTEEIWEELLRWRHKWSRVVQLKYVEAGLRGLSISTESDKIYFSPEAYALHVEVIDLRVYIMFE